MTVDTLSADVLVAEAEAIVQAEWLSVWRCRHEQSHERKGIGVPADLPADDWPGPPRLVADTAMGNRPDAPGPRHRERRPRPRHWLGRAVWATQRSPPDLR